ncbi:conserved oligomeric Golgi complex subunit 8 isoform X1 [Hydra vulgaris]|uniref:conserved oligomeric Golgi complex subunit 8 isoform X1 n=1 Tax=Hydra vulgaris TaxID=6087 RepID=UPI001F5E77AB|nr:conserved oligomeric Golgi complex subunit 8 isoform X1 [Hydra vulgaris]
MMVAEEHVDFSFETIAEDRSLVHFLLKNKNELDEDDESFCQQYIENLASNGLSNLSSIPESINQERKNVTKKTQSLAFENYQTFIQAAECSSKVYNDFNIMERHLNSTLEKLPQFIEKLNSFEKSSLNINLCRKQNSLVLSKHTQLLEILEVPQLMNTCVRNGNYEEALDLMRFVRGLEKKFFSIRILVDIGSKVNSFTQLMLNQLLEQLRDNIQLPACLRIISYIRLLDVFSESELRLTFLQARDSWLKSLLLDIPQNDAYTYLVKVIEVNRVNLFDIVTQYKAIFSDGHPSYSKDKSFILQSWITRKISEFVLVLSKMLTPELICRMESIYSHCMYFGLSFSRIGADFRGLLVPIFQKVILHHFKHTVDITTTRFRDNIRVYTTFDHKRKENEKKLFKSDSFTPPHHLLCFPPIVFYTNGILGAFNDLRQFPALSFVFIIKKIIQSSLEKSMSALEEWARLESQSTKNIEEIRILCQMICMHFLPFIKQAFEMFFPAIQMSEMIARLPSSQGTQFYSLDIKYLQNYLKDFVDISTLNEDVLIGIESNKETIGIESNKEMIIIESNKE